MSKRQKRKAPDAEVTTRFRTKTGAENDRIIVDEIFRTFYGKNRFDKTSGRLVEISIKRWREARNPLTRVNDHESHSRYLMRLLSKLDALEKLHLEFEGDQKMELIQPKERSLENLKELVVHSHRYDTEVEIWRFPNLETLDIYRVSMKPLPKKGLTKLKTLKVKIFPGVRRQHSYRHLLSAIESLSTLEYLKIRDFDGKFLHDTIRSLCCLPMLKHLDLSDITEMTAVPDEIGNLKSLEKLHLRVQNYCIPLSPTGLGLLPNAIRRLTLLEVLDLSGAITTHSFPSASSAIGDLINLKRIRLPFLTDLPDEFGKLTKLQFIALYDWGCKSTRSSENTQLSKIQKLTKNMKDLRALHLPIGVFWRSDSQQKILQIAQQCPFLGCLGGGFCDTDALVMGTIFCNQARAHIPLAAPIKILSCALIYLKKHFSEHHFWGHPDSYKAQEPNVIFQLLNEVIGIHDILSERE